MTRIITGVYNDQTTGQAAADALRQRGFGADAVRIDSGAQDGVEASLLGHGLSQADANAFAGVARNGGAVVSARAEFGEAARATQVLESFSPSEIRSTSARGFTGNAHTGTGRQTATTPESIGDNPAPLSSSLGLPVLSESDKPSAALISDNAAPLSKSLGLPVLSQSDRPSAALMSDNPAPFSALLHLPLLTRSDSAHANLPSGKAAPFSDAFKLPTLSHNPAPFSSLFKLPLLSRDRHTAP